MSARVFLAVAGSIGSGKTTLTERLTDRLGFQGLYESTEDNPYLSDFYGDMERWALPLQLRFLAVRVKATRELQQKGVSAIQDRTCYEDAEIFAAHLHERGALSARDWDTYGLLSEQLLRDLDPPDLLVYLRRSPEGCQKLIENRGRNYEQAIPFDYLVNLGQSYDQWFERYQRGEKLLVRAEDHDFLHSEDDLDRLVRTIEGRLPQPLLLT